MKVMTIWLLPQNLSSPQETDPMLFLRTHIVSLCTRGTNVMHVSAWNYSRENVSGDVEYFSFMSQKEQLNLISFIEIQCSKSTDKPEARSAKMYNNRQESRA